MYKILLITLILSSYVTLNQSKKYDESTKPEWAKKDIRDFSDADLERLFDQWEEDEEPLDDDELPEYLRPQPKIDFSRFNQENPEELISALKKGRALMTFVAVSGDPTNDEMEVITKLWQTSLWNNHIQAERYLLDGNRAIFLYKDGSQAWVGKDFLIQQEKCESVTIEGKVYPGRFSVINSPLHSSDEL